MNSYLDRTYHFKGSPRQIGFTAGQTFAASLEQTISRYIARVKESKDLEKLHAGALPWLRRLPARFQDEFEGMAEGAGISLQRLAEWAYIEECDAKQCSGAVCLFENQAWVARNNDFFAPELWGYMTIRELRVGFQRLTSQWRVGFSHRQASIRKSCGYTITSCPFGIRLC